MRTELHAGLLGILGVTMSVQASPVTVNYDYDLLGRLTKASYAGSQAVSYTFDRAGNITAVTQTGATLPSEHIGLYDGATGTFYLRNAHGAGSASLTYRFGPKNVGWAALSGDWDGDGSATIGLYDPATGTFYLRNAHGAGSANLTYRFGPKNAGWKALSGDWDGDGKTTIGLYDPATGTFYLRNAHGAGSANLTYRFGPKNAGWKVLSGDWDGDGKTTIGLYDPATGIFYLRNAHGAGSANLTYRFGPKNAGWKALSGDWDGDGKTTVGLYDPATGTFYLRNTHETGSTVLTYRFGPKNAGWTPLAGAWTNSSSAQSPMLADSLKSQSISEKAMPEPRLTGAAPVLTVDDLPVSLRALLESHQAQASEAYVTADGARLVFTTVTGLVDEDRNRVSDIYVYDLRLDRVELVSVNASGTPGNAPSTGGRLDGAGERAVFVSAASNLVTDDTNDVSDLFIRDLRSQTTERVSLGLAGEQADGASHSASLDASGEWVVFVSEAGNLVADDGNGVADIFLRDVASGLTDRLSLEATGLEAAQASAVPAMDDAATVVAYERPDADGREQVYVVEVPDGHGLPVDVSSTLTETPLRHSRPAVSADGRYLATVLRDESGAISGLWVEHRATAAAVKLPWPAQAQTDEPALLFSEQGQFLLLRQQAAGDAAFAAAARLESWVIVRNPLQSN